MGQARPVEVTYLAYEGTLQAEALGLVAAKTRASLMVEGELPAEGLAALDGDGGDVYLALARRLADSGDVTGERRQSLETLFGEARRDEVEADELFVAGDWAEEAGVTGDRAPTPFGRPPTDAGCFADLPLFAPALGATGVNDRRLCSGADRVSGTA